MARGLQVCHDLGAPVLQVAGYYCYYEEPSPDAEHWYGRLLADAVPMAARLGVVMGIENVDGTDVTSIRKAMEFVDPSRKSAPARMDSSQPMASELWSRMSVPSIRARNCRTQEIPGSVVSDCMFVAFSVGVVHCRPHRHGGLWVGRTRICQTD